jgi:hypothetical protein
MANPSRKSSRTTRLQKTELVPITDQAQQEVLDRVFTTKKITKEDRRILKQTDSTRNRQGKT